MLLQEAEIVLRDLSTRAGFDTLAMIQYAQETDPRQSLKLVTMIYPEVVEPYMAAADLVGQEFYMAQPDGDRHYRPVAAALPPREALGANARWMALNADAVNVAGVLTRTVYGAFRTSQAVNAAVEHGELDTGTATHDLQAAAGSINTGYETMWARVARGSACQFCQVLATRDPVFRSARAGLGVVGRGGEARGRQEMGARYHDHCRCAVVPVRPGGRFVPDRAAPEWIERYDEAIRHSLDAKGRWDLSAVANYLETQFSARTADA